MLLAKLALTSTSPMLSRIVVDDMLFSESDDKFVIYEATMAFLRGKYPSGLTGKREPGGYAGYKVEDIILLSY